MPVEPPSPFYERRFSTFVDENPPQRMSTDAIEAELIFWSEWLNARDYVGKAPVPGRAIRFIGLAVELAGAVTTLFGIFGLASAPISVVTAIAGVGIFSIGLVIDNAGRTRTAPAIAALERVSIRQATLFAALSNDKET